MKLPSVATEAFMLDKMKITYNVMKSWYIQKAMWRCGSQIFIVFEI